MSQTVTIIKPTSGWHFIDFAELWRYRELLFTLVERDVRVRYKQTMIGGLWAIMQPFLTMVVFSFFFGKLAKIPTDGIPYPVFSYAGLLLWTYFSSALTAGSKSLAGNSSLITKVYFPRIILPLAATLTPLVDYLIAAVLMIGIMLYYHMEPTLFILLTPIVTIFTWLLAAGMSLWMGSLNVKYRDVGIAIPFFIQLLLFVTPIIYPASVAERFQLILWLNPLSGFMEAHRALILGQMVNGQTLLISIGLTALIVISGGMYLKRTERFFADVI